MRATLHNLEEQEQAIASAYRNGVVTLRFHLYQIKKHRLFEAKGYDNFESYVKGESCIPVEYSQAIQLAANGEVQEHIAAIAKKNSGAPEFSDRALKQLSTIRVNGTHDMDVPAIRKAAQKAIALAKEQESTRGVTSAHVNEAKSLVVEEKDPKPFGEQIEKEISRVGKMRVSLEQLEEHLADADIEYPGCVKRLAKAYSDAASMLRKALQ